MDTKRLGNAGFTVSKIGLGCMSLPLHDEALARTILHRAVDAGVNFFDTADLYAEGANEAFVGETLRPYGDQVIIATKVGNRFTLGKPGWTWDASPSYLKGAVEASLRRLNRETIDLLQLHGGTMDDSIEDIIALFDGLVREGKVRAYGISSIRPSVIRTYVDKSSMASVMSQYSLLDRRPEEAVLPLLEKHNIGLIARGPVASGLLTDRPKDLGDDYLGYEKPVIRQLQDGLSSLRAGATRAQMAILYSLGHPAVATVIPGASSLAQLEDNIGAAALAPLTDEERSILQHVAPANVYTLHR